MAYIYFSRTQPPHPMQATPLVSGVIEADTPEAAKDKLDKLLTRSAGGKGFSRAADFDFTDLATVERSDHGVLVITMREE